MDIGPVVVPAGPHAVPFARGGAGGVGGGGHAAWFNTTSQHPTPASIQPEWPRIFS